MPRYIIVVLCLLFCVFSGGCGSGGGSGDTNDDSNIPHVIPIMASSNYDLETAVIGYGGGSVSSANYNGIVTISLSAGTCTGQGYNCQVGFVHATNGRLGY